jgi:hypothetical protein
LIDGGLRKLFHSSLKGFHWQAVETGLTGAGVPDSNFCKGGIEGWIEHKQTDAMAIKVKGAQVGWIEQRLRHGGRVFVAVRQTTTAGPRKGSARDGLWLYHGSAIRRLYEVGLKHQDQRLGYWPGPPNKWDWREIEQILLR